MIQRVFCIELRESEQKMSNVALNQGNRDSVRFRFRVFDDAQELDYTRFSAVRATFGHRGSALASCECEINSDGIICVPPEGAFARHGIINGQLDLAFEPGANLATNYFNFTVTPSLAMLSKADSHFFNDQIQALLQQLAQTTQVAEDDLVIFQQNLRQILDDMTTEAALAVDGFNAEITRLREQANAIFNACAT